MCHVTVRGEVDRYYRHERLLCAEGGIFWDRPMVEVKRAETSLMGGPREDGMGWAVI
jgi:hypothetical protein